MLNTQCETHSPSYSAGIWPARAQTYLMAVLLRFMYGFYSAFGYCAVEIPYRTVDIQKNNFSHRNVLTFPGIVYMFIY